MHEHIALREWGEGVGRLEWEIFKKYHLRLQPHFDNYDYGPYDAQPLNFKPLETIGLPAETQSPAPTTTTPTTTTPSTPSTTTDYQFTVAQWNGYNDGSRVNSIVQWENSATR